MKPRSVLLSVALMLFATIAFAQSDAKKSFDTLKILAGSWEGPITITPKPNEMNMGENTRTHVTMRVTSRGNALVHEMQEAGTPEDPTRYDHPVTMFYLDGDRLLLTHYCDAGNRPRMVARTSPDGKTTEFDFLDIAGNTQYGHMQHAVFTTVDANHHIEDWTFLMPGDKAFHAHLDLRRTN
jgi:phage tail protein X